MSSGAPQPWTKAQFIAVSSAAIGGLKWRETRLVVWFIGSTLLCFAALGLGGLLRGHLDKAVISGAMLGVVGLYLLFIIVFAIYIVATGGSHARRHRVECHACAAEIPLQVPQFESGRMRYVRIEDLFPDRFPLHCPGCGALVAHG